MPVFTANRAIATSEPFVTVENELAEGEHRFQLQVVRRDGVSSEPDIAVVTVTRLRIDTPSGPIRPVSPTDSRINRPS